MRLVEQSFLTLALTALTASMAPPALGQRAVLYADGYCHYEVPSGSFCNRRTGECYTSATGSTFIGNWIRDCNFDGSVATTSVAPSGATPDSCGLSGYACTEDSDCCSNDYNLKCETEGQPPNQIHVCAHTGVGGVGGGCVSGSKDCFGDLQCMWDSGSAYSQTCQSKPSWTAAMWAPAAKGLVIAGTDTPVQVRFNSIQATWWVPSSPINPEDINNTGLWIGLQTADGSELIQPELNYDGDGNYWSLNAQYVHDNNFLNAVSSEATYQNDTIVGEAIIYHGDVDGDGDYWQATATDTTVYPNVTAQLNMWTQGDGGTGSGNPAYTTAITAILEVQGQVACDGLPEGGNVDFTLTGLTQEGTAWNDYIDVIPNVSYYTTSDGHFPTPPANDFNQPPAPAPACSYGAFYYAYAQPIAQLVWADGS